jgi:stage V sporulation protein D (sporulation-specific penicillin-binding protein)
MERSSFEANRQLRYNLVFSAFLLGAACLAAHLFFLQFHGPTRRYYEAKVEERWHSYAEPEGRRGDIYYRDGTLIAGTRKVARVLIEPGMINALEDVSLTLSQHLGVPAEDIREKINKCKVRSMELAKGVDLGTSLAIDRAQLRGVFTRYYYERTYPHGAYCAGPTVGYAGAQDFQRLGLEKSCDAILTGRKGKIVFRKDANRKRLPGSVLDARSKEDGTPVYTTLHPSIQTICEDELRHAAEENGSDWGCIVVMNPDNGEVLGASTYPTFDPNEYVAGRLGDERNILVHNAVEPGSTVKPLLAAYALDQGWINATQRWVCNRILSIDGYRVREAELSHVIGDAGGAKLDKILINSSNIGMAQIAMELGQDRVLQAYESLGFFARTGVELPSESRGLKPCRWQKKGEKWPRITLATTGFGQGMSVTPLQLAAAYCTLANGGYRVQPTLVLHSSDGAETPEDNEITMPEGEILMAGFGDKPRLELKAPEDLTPGPGGRVRVLRKETCDQVTQWLEQVVIDGTGKQARLQRFRAAGKTGTGQIPSPRGGYQAGAYLSSFAGYFPVEDPRYMVLVMFYHPRGAYYGGVVAAPVFKKVGDRISYVDVLAPAARAEL